MGINQKALPGSEARPEPAPAEAGFAGIRRPNLTHLAWLQAVIATGGSLYFSEVMQFTPCVLCWYQRIAMYPLVVILTVGILLRERRLRFYVLPLSLIGLAISLYHNLFYYGVIPEGPCTAGVPCDTRYINWFGFVSIPLLALVAFTVISVSMLLHLPDQVGIVEEYDEFGA